MKKSTTSHRAVAAGRVFGAAVALLATSAFATLAGAQSLPAGVHVGMAASELQSVVPDLHRVARPERMSNGARGIWQQPQAGDDGLMFELTWFVRGPSVERADLVLVAAPDGNAAAFERIVGTLRAQFGSELRSRETMGASVSETASWTSGDEDIAAYMVGPRDAEKVRIVYKRRELKDASAL